MKRRLRRLGVATAATYIGALIVLMLLENTLMYPAPATNNGDWEPTWLGHEEVHFESADGTRLHGWFCEHPAARGVLLLCHGNGEHLAFLADELEAWREEFGLSVMAFDYRGYGKSGGKAFESGILADGEAAQSWLAERTGQPPESIILFGRSLGGAVAVHLASQKGAKGLILDRTFSSMVDVAADMFPWAPVRWLLRNRYPSDEKILAYQGPLLQIHGLYDRVVPYRFAEKLFAASPSADKQLLTSDTLGHNDAWPDEFYQSLHAFIDSLTAAGGGRADRRGGRRP